MVLRRQCLGAASTPIGRSPLSGLLPRLLYCIPLSKFLTPLQILGALALLAWAFLRNLTPKARQQNLQSSGPCLFYLDINSHCRGFRILPRPLGSSGRNEFASGAWERTPHYHTMIHAKLRGCNASCHVLVRALNQCIPVMDETRSWQDLEALH